MRCDLVTVNICCYGELSVYYKGPCFISAFGPELLWL
jgi:hypothetical protein